MIMDHFVIYAAIIWNVPHVVTMRPFRVGLTQVTHFHYNRFNEIGAVTT